MGVAVGWYATLIGMGSSATIKMNEDSTVSLITGFVDHGTGNVHGGLPIFISNELGIDVDKINISSGDTETGPWDYGTVGSRSTYNHVRAVGAAIEELKREIRKRGAGMLEADPDEVEFEEGKVFVRSAPDKAIPLGLLCATAGKPGFARTHDGQRLVQRPALAAGPGCRGDARHPQLRPARVRGPGRGGGGRSGNRKREGVENRLGLRRGIRHQSHRRGGPDRGRAPFSRSEWASPRQMFFDDKGHLLNPSFLDYKVPLAPDIPEFDTIVVESQSDQGAMGTKGIGEAPVVATAAAIASAVSAATGATFDTDSPDAGVCPQPNRGGSRNGIDSLGGHFKTCPSKDFLVGLEVRFSFFGEGRRSLLGVPSSPQKP